jgi:hypothetical protein
MRARILFLLFTVLAAGALGAALLAPEKPDLPPETLARMATHVVVGEVRQIWSRKERSGGWDTERLVAEIAVESVEKGDDLEPGELVYARYWHRRWAFFGQGPTDTSGHRGLPEPEERVRVYLARDAYDGFGRTDDHGFNVIGANGFARP